jgi:N-acetylneuraminic acid mutarotase
VAIGYFPMIILRGRPYVFGGGDDSSTLNTVYTFDTSNVWSARTPMERTLEGHTAVALNTDTALVCGGANDDGPTLQSACYSYATASDAWSQAAQLNTARNCHGMTVYKGVRIALFVLNYSVW